MDSRNRRSSSVKCFSRRLPSGGVRFIGHDEILLGLGLTYGQYDCQSNLAQLARYHTAPGTVKRLICVLEG
jgi:hypothetical protein